MMRFFFLLLYLFLIPIQENGFCSDAKISKLETKLNKSQVRIKTQKGIKSHTNKYKNAKINEIEMIPVKIEKIKGKKIIKYQKQKFIVGKKYRLIIRKEELK